MRPSGRRDCVAAVAAVAAVVAAALRAATGRRRRRSWPGTHPADAADAAEPPADVRVARAARRDRAVAAERSRRRGAVARRMRRSAATIGVAADAGGTAPCQRAPHASLSRPFAAAVPTWTLALRPDVVRGWAAGALAAADVAAAGASRRAVADDAARTAAR